MLKPTKIRIDYSVHVHQSLYLRTIKSRRFLIYRIYRRLFLIRSHSAVTKFTKSNLQVPNTFFFLFFSSTCWCVFGLFGYA